MPDRIALIGGVYSNYLALQAAIDDAERRGVDAIYCLGDLGAFGPYPDRVFLSCKSTGSKWCRGIMIIRSVTTCRIVNAATLTRGIIILRNSATIIPTQIPMQTISAG